MTRDHKCATQSLVQALYDERLGAREVASVERHLTSCASCNKFYLDLGTLAALGKLAGETADPTPLERQRARTKLLQLAATPKEVAEVARPRFGRRVTMALAAAVFGVLAVVWWQTGGFAGAPAVATAFLDGIAVEAPAASASAPRVDALVTPAPHTRMSRVSSGATERVLLEDGTVAIEVARLHGGQRFIVATRDAEVEVRGTRFSVSAAHGSLLGVVVSEGLVEVRHGGVSLMLRAGESWSRPQTAAADAVSTAPATSSNGAGSANGPAAVAVRPQAPRATPRAPQGAADVNERSAAFARAVRLMEAGEHAEASSALDKFAQENGADPRAEDAAFLAIIALQRGGQKEAAAAAARDYLRRYPNGFRRSDAAVIAQGAASE